jgi:hypothetical protein
MPCRARRGPGESARSATGDADGLSRPVLPWRVRRHHRDLRHGQGRVAARLADRPQPDPARGAVGRGDVFIDRFKYSPAFGSYPLGLVVALLWAYTQKSIDNLRTGPTSVRILALLHLLVSALVTGAAAFVATVPAYLQVRAEWEVSLAERVDEMRLMRNASRDQPPPGGRAGVRPGALPPASATLGAGRRASRVGQARPRAQVAPCAST